MRERDIEQKLVKAVKGRGGLALKLTCPGYTGMPDRMVLFPGGKLCFVEVKAPGKVPRPLQVARHRMLQGMGFLVFVLDDPAQIDGVIEEALHGRCD